MEVKEGYKQTEVGVIPEDWEVLPVTKVTSEIFLGLTSKVDYVNNGGIPLVRATDIADGKLSFDKARNISIEQHKSLTKYRKAKRGDVLVSKSGSLGVCAIVDVDHEFSIYESIIVLQSKPMLCPEFLLWLMRDERTQIRMIGEKVGSSVAHLNIEMFRKLVIQITTLAEQIDIATALSEADALIHSLEKLIAKKRAIKQGVMQELLTGKKRLPGFGTNTEKYKQTEVGVIPEDWEVKPLEGLCINKGLVRGPFGGALKKDYFVESGIKVYEQKNAIYRSIDLGDYFIDHQKYVELKRFDVQSNDFVVSCSGTIGKIYLIPQNAPKGIINQALLKITTDNMKVSKKYFFYYFDWEKFQERIIDNTQGGAMKNLVGMSVFRETKIPLPPTIEEQTAIANALSDMDAEISTLETKLTKYKQIKQGMMQTLLTGRIRLI